MILFVLQVFFKNNLLECIGTHSWFVSGVYVMRNKQNSLFSLNAYV